MAEEVLGHGTQVGTFFGIPLERPDVKRQVGELVEDQFGIGSLNGVFQEPAGYRSEGSGRYISEDVQVPVGKQIEVDCCSGTDLQSSVAEKLQLGSPRAVWQFGAGPR